MTPGRRQFQRLCAIALLVLAASPLTAPFSSGHPLDLLGGSAAHVQSKKAPDDPVVSLGILPVPPTGDVVAMIATPRPLIGRDRGVDALRLPLRL